MEIMLGKRKNIQSLRKKITKKPNQVQVSN